MKAIILAAGMASRLRPLTNTTPKCLLKIGERCLLKRSMDALIAGGLNEFVIVTGYLHEMIETFVGEEYGDKISVKFIYNDVYDSTNNIYSLWLALKAIPDEDVLLLDSDLVYDPQIIPLVLKDSHDNILTLIRHELGEEEIKIITEPSTGKIVELNKTCDPKKAIGESLGIEKMGKAYATALFAEMDTMICNEGLKNVFYEKAFERVIPQGHNFNMLDVTDYFSCELDTVEDFNNAKEKIPAELF